MLPSLSPYGGCIRSSAWRILTLRPAGTGAGSVRRTWPAMFWEQSNTKTPGAGDAIEVGTSSACTVTAGKACGRITVGCAPPGSAFRTACVHEPSAGYG